MSAPRTKPWEVSSGTSSATATGDNMNSIGGSTINPTSDSSSTQAQVPDRPTSLTSDLSSMSNTSPYGSTGYGSAAGSRYGGGYGSSMYGGGLGSSMYGDGGYGSSMYGGGLGSSMYGGGYGSGMYGMGGMGGMGGYGMGGMGGYGGMYGQQRPGMGGGLAEGTQATFQLIESIIGAVGGFAQMLEATYMATHSSFFTMISVAEQFGNLKNALGSLLGIFAVIKFAKKIFYKITGKTYDYGISVKEFTKFEKGQKKLEENIRKQQSGKPPRISFKPLLLFLAASIGFPYLLSKAIQKIAEQQQRKQQMLGGGAPGPVNPSNLQFAKALYEFNPENPNIEIELKPNELVAILSKLDPMGNESKWWKVRSRLGKVGYVPLNYLGVIERKVQQIEPSKPIPNQNPQVPVSEQPASNQHLDKPFNEKLSVEEFKSFQS
mmetsp:Transcript_6722/g.6619  ORF Transcript_6722/g.6619 Transcript_6722/m.6619 type:complete len:434 (+) Transcript_6722:378-1679(+)